MRFLTTLIAPVLIAGLFGCSKQSSSSSLNQSEQKFEDFQEMFTNASSSDEIINLINEKLHGYPSHKLNNANFLALLEHILDHNFCNNQVRTAVGGLLLSESLISDKKKMISNPAALNISIRIVKNYDLEDSKTLPSYVGSTNTLSRLLNVQRTTDVASEIETNIPKLLKLSRFGNDPRSYSNLLDIIFSIASIKKLKEESEMTLIEIAKSRPKTYRGSGNLIVASSEPLAHLGALSSGWNMQSRVALSNIKNIDKVFSTALDNFASKEIRNDKYFDTNRVVYWLERALKENGDLFKTTPDLQDQVNKLK